MRLLDVEDFIYFFVYKKYKKWAEKENQSIYALCFITLMQQLNIFSFFLFLLVLKVIDISIFKRGYLFFLLGIVLLGLNYWYIFKYRGKDMILNKYGNVEEVEKIKIYALIYVLLTLVIFIGLMIYYIYFT